MINFQTTMKNIFLKQSQIKGEQEIIKFRININDTESMLEKINIYLQFNNVREFKQLIELWKGKLEGRQFFVSKEKF